MNNDYDRDHGPRYTMSSFNKDLRDLVENPDELIDISDPEPSIKILMLKSGEQIIGELTSSIPAGQYVIHNPKLIQSIAADPNSSQNVTVTFSEWMSLSSDTSFYIPEDFVAIVCDPHPLVKSNYTSGN